MNNEPITARFINNRVYFGLNDKNGSLFIEKNIKIENQETGMKYHWNLTGFVLWVLGLSYKIHYTENGSTNFVFVNKKSCQSWIEKYRNEFSIEKFSNQQKAIKVICQRAASKISISNSDQNKPVLNCSSVKKPEKQTIIEISTTVPFNPISIDDQNEAFLSYDDAIKKAEEKFSKHAEKEKVIERIKKYLIRCDYKNNVQLNKRPIIEMSPWEFNTSFMKDVEPMKFIRDVLRIQIEVVHGEK